MGLRCDAYEEQPRLLIWASDNDPQLIINHLGQPIQSSREPPDYIPRNVWPRWRTIRSPAYKCEASIFFTPTLLTLPSPHYLMNPFLQPADAIAGHPVLCLSTIVIGCVAVTHLARRITRPPLPPGPKGLPVIGNLLDVPPTSAWKTFSAWSEKWGR